MSDKEFKEMTRKLLLEHDAKMRRFLDEIIQKDRRGREQFIKSLNCNSGQIAHK